MERDMFNWAVEQMKCQRGGTKEACIIVREFLKARHSSTHDAIDKCRHWGISVSDIVRAADVLKAYAFQKEDVIPKEFTVEQKNLGFPTEVKVNGKLRKIGKRERHIRGGLKEAFVIILQFILSARKDEYALNFCSSCITVGEFISALKVLLAFTLDEKDQIPETWCCDITCDGTNSIFCHGEFNLMHGKFNFAGCKENAKRCPYYREECK